MLDRQQQFKYLLQSLCKFLGYVSSDPMTEFGAFQPGCSDVNIALACTVNLGGLLNPVPNIDLPVNQQR